MKKLVETYLAGTHNDYNNPETATELSNFLCCILKYIETQRKGQYVLTPEQRKQIIQLALNIGSNGPISVPLRTNFYQFIQNTDPKLIDELDSDLRSTFVNRISQWITQNVIIYYYESGDDSLVNGVAALVKATKNLKLNPDVIKNCVTALVLVLKNHEDACTLVDTVITNIFKANIQRVVENSFGLVFSQNERVRKTFYKAFLKGNILGTLSLKKINWPKNVSDLAIDAPFTENISDKIPEAQAETISMNMVQASIAKTIDPKTVDAKIAVDLKVVDEEFISRMIDHELTIGAADKNMILRSDNITARNVRNYAKTIGFAWAKGMFVETVRELNCAIKQGQCFEIDPSKGKTDPAKFTEYLSKIVEGIVKKFERAPIKMHFLGKTLYKKATEKYGDFGLQITLNFFFLKFILPLIYDPDNLKIDPELDPRTKEVLVNMAIVLMSAIDKDEPKDKKDFFKSLNEFADKARQQLEKAVKEFIDHELTVVEKAKTQQFNFNEIVIENDLIRNFSIVYDAIHPFFPTQPEYKRVVNYIKEYHFSHVGRIPQLNKSGIKMDEPGLQSILEETVPEYLKLLFTDVFIRVSDNLIIFNRSKLPVWPLTKTLITHVLSVLSEQKGEFSVVFDCSPLVNSEPCLYLDKCFDTILNAIPQETIDNLKELVVINGSEQLMEKMDSSIIKRKVINAEKCDNFDMKFSGGFEHFDHDFAETLATTTTTDEKGEPITVLVCKKYMCIQKVVNSRICSNIIKYPTIDKVEKTPVPDSPGSQNLSIFIDGKKLSLVVNDESFVNLLSTNIWKAARYTRMTFDPINMKLVMNIARALNKEKTDELIPQEKVSLFSEFLTLSKNIKLDLAYSILERANEVYDLKSLKENSDIYNYIMDQKN